MRNGMRRTDTLRIAVIAGDFSASMIGVATSCVLTRWVLKRERAMPCRQISGKLHYEQSATRKRTEWPHKFRKKCGMMKSLFTIPQRISVTVEGEGLCHRLGPDARRDGVEAAVSTVHDLDLVGPRFGPTHRQRDLPVASQRLCGENCRAV